MVSFFYSMCHALVVDDMLLSVYLNRCVVVDRLQCRDGFRQKARNRRSLQCRILMVGVEFFSNLLFVFVLITSFSLSTITFRSSATSCRMLLFSSISVTTAAATLTTEPVGGAEHPFSNAPFTTQQSTVLCAAIKRLYYWATSVIFLADDPFNISFSLLYPLHDGFFCLFAASTRISLRMITVQ